MPQILGGRWERLGELRQEQGFTSPRGAEQKTDPRREMPGCKSSSAGSAEHILPHCTVKIRLLVTALSTFRGSLRTEPGEGSCSHSQLAKADCSAAPYQLVISPQHGVSNAAKEEAARFGNFASFLGKLPPPLLPGHAHRGAAGGEAPAPPRRRCWAGAKGSGQKFRAPTSSREQGSEADKRSSPAPLPSGVTEG